MSDKESAVLIHYPSGGFGHFVYALISLSTDIFYIKDKELNFSSSGDAHSFELNSDPWMHFTLPYKFTPKEWATGLEKKYIVLVDSGIHQDDPEVIIEQFPTNLIIRLCIDSDAKSIVNQTCLYKAVCKNDFDYYSDLDWERREQITKQYHYIEETPDYFLNNFRPVNLPTVLNINISRLFFDFDNVIKDLGNFLGVNFNCPAGLYKKFLTANQKYTNAGVWAKKILATLAENSDDLDLTSITSLHDQGYINFCLEKVYNLQEIPPYDYRNWFTNTAEIKTAIEKLQNEK